MRGRGKINVHSVYRKGDTERLHPVPQYAPTIKIGGKRRVRYFMEYGDAVMWLEMMRNSIIDNM